MVSWFKEPWLGAGFGRGDGKDYNGDMSEIRSILRRFVVSGFLMAAFAASIIHAQDTDNSKRGRKYKAPPATSHVEVTVLRATNGKPIENAAVVFHPLVDGHDNGNMELKTNDEGKAIIDLLETGTNVRVQIIADGFQTYGGDYKVDKDTMAIEVKLKRPAAQYSIYKQNEGAGKHGDATPAKPDAAPKSTDTQDQAKPNADQAKPDAAADNSKPQDSSSQPK